MASAAAPSSLTGNTTEPLEPPLPPRFWWLKRLTVLTLLYFALLAGVRWWWGRIADARLAALIADARARGEPVFPEEFAPRKVPDDQNAAILFDQAAAALVTTPQFSRLYPQDQSKSLSPSELQVIGTNVAANRRALDLARQAATRPAASWGAGDNYRQIVRKHVIPQRDLAKLLWCASIYSHAIGKDREALSLVIDLLAQSRAMDAGPTTLLTRLTALVMERHSTSAIRRFAYDLQLDSTNAGAATPVQMHDLISLLLDDEHYHMANVRGWFAARAEVLDSSRRLDDLLESRIDRFLKPTYQLDGARTIAWIGDEARAARATNSEAYSAQLPHIDENDGISSFYILARPSAGIIERRIGPDIFYQSDVERRTAACELAIRLYRVDHAGAYPPSLGELVREYLPAVPRDARAADDRPLAYNRNTQPPVLYTVRATTLNADTRGPLHRALSMTDDVFLLEPLPPPQRSIKGSELPRR